LWKIKKIGDKTKKDICGTNKLLIIHQIKLEAMLKKTINMYCDESCHLENDGKNYMLIGYVSSEYNQIEIHHRHIKELKEKHHFYGEIKWSKVSKSKYQFYHDLIDYFFASDLYFRCIVVNKSEINNVDFSQNFDMFYYEIYYRLLNHKIDMRYKYNVYLDIKDTLSAFKVRKLKEVLNTQYGTFGNVQNIRSHESLLMQLTDLLMGALSYNLNHEKKVIAKNNLIEKLKEHTDTPLIESTPYKHQKFNLFFIDLKK
jgi:Protein of unknown function (DUF3800)